MTLEETIKNLTELKEALVWRINTKGRDLDTLNSALNWLDILDGKLKQEREV
jgi:hypothetical protein